MYYAGFNGRKLAVHLAYENGKYEVHVSGKQQSLDFLWPIRSIGSEYPKEHGTICNLRGLLQGRRTFGGYNFRVSGLLIRVRVALFDFISMSGHSFVPWSQYVGVPIWGFCMYLGVLRRTLTRLIKSPAEADMRTIVNRRVHKQPNHMYIYIYI